MLRFVSVLLGMIAVLWTASAAAEDAKPARKYFAHPVVEDRYGVIAPWHRGQNGQCDFRVRIAAETLKRYPWTEPGQAVVPAPHFVFNGGWSIQPNGTIHVKPTVPDWENGDVGQRAASLLFGLTDYYRYTGDPAAIGIIAMTADYLLDYCQTPPDHPWPGFFISAPTKGKAYGRADPHGLIQLDLSACVGSGMIAAYKVTGSPRYWEAAKHWADLLAEKCNSRAGAQPWGRYANPEDVPWKTDVQTAGVVFIVQFLDDVIHSGYAGKGDVLASACAAGEKYLRDTVLPQWTRDPTFGHHYWDWQQPTTGCVLPVYVSQYLMDHRESFPAWKNDARNIVSLLFCRLSVSPESMGGVYSGAWAIPEANNCCGKSMSYTTVFAAAALARYGVLADSAWARKIARRQTILTTYDTHETGVVEDGIDGGVVVGGDWFNLAHPLPLRFVMQLLAWQSELLGANRENHIVRTASVVRDVRYGKGQVAYRTHDAPAPSEDVLRLAFSPKSVSADGRPLQQREELSRNGYTLKPLPNGDCIVAVRHDGCRSVLVEGDDPQEAADDGRLRYEGTWTIQESPDASGGSLHVADAAGAGASFEFEGNQVRLIGRADPSGGKADVYLDGVKQLCGIDFWCPQTRDRQVMCYKNGLSQGKHTLKVVASGAKNARAGGTRVYVDAVQWSAAQGEAGFGAGGGPVEPQRVIFGYVGRTDYVDSQGRRWRPATEFVARHYSYADLVPLSLWTEPRIKEVGNADDPELYRYGIHGQDFSAYFTVGPQAAYYARIKLCQPDKPTTPGQFATTIDIQGKRAATDVDVAATAGGVGRAVDLVFNDIRPENGLIAVRFWHHLRGEAMVQAVEIGPGQSRPGARPVQFRFPPDVNLLANPGFEDKVCGAVGGERLGPLAGGDVWNYKFIGTSQGVVLPESQAKASPQAGAPQPHSGKDALRTQTVEGNAHVQVYQEVLVDPRTTYRASAWVRGTDARGKGFGTNPADSAGVCIAELDANDRVLVEHPKAAVTKACEFTELAKTFTTAEKTAKVRFTLDTVIDRWWQEGHVTYDDCALVRQAN